MKPVLSILNHTLVAGVGWALVVAIRPPLPPPSVENGGTTTEAARPQASIRDRKSWQGDGGRLLRELSEKVEKLEDFSDISPSADRAVAAMAALERWRANPRDPTIWREVCARLSHWIETDPKAAVAYWNRQAMSLGYRLDEMLVAAVTKNASPATLLICLEPFDRIQLLGGSGEFHIVSLGPREVALLSLLAKSLAGAASSSPLADSLKTLNPTFAQVLLRQTIQAWPESRLETLAPLLAGNFDRDALTAYLQRLRGDQQRSWLLAQFAGDIPADREQAPLLRNLLNHADTIPLQERIDWTKRLDHASSRMMENTATPEYLVKEDIGDFLTRANLNEDGQLSDWRYRLQHNQLTAAEILAEIQRALPTAAASEPELLLRSVFQHLVQDAPEGAMSLLDGLPVAEREKLMLDSASSLGRFNNPQALFDLVSTLPPSSGSDGNERFKVWVQAANPDDDRLGDSYGAWVMSLPPGVERDMALSALASRFDVPDPQAATAYRAAKTLPEGWKPGQK